jgi:glycerol kinase
MGGVSIMWAKKGLGLFNTYEELNEMIASVKDSGDVYFVPGAFDYKMISIQWVVCTTLEI